MKLFCTVLTVALGLALAGCAAKHDNRPAVHPVRGKLLVGGKPAPNARITLCPTADAKLARLRPHAIVEGDGSYQLSTFTTRDGAPVGDFAFTVVLPGPLAQGQAEDEQGPDLLGGRYADPKKPAASIHIAADTVELSLVDLTPAASSKPLSAPRPAIEQ